MARSYRSIRSAGAIALSLAVLAFTLYSCVSLPPPAEDKALVSEPIIVAHRGASGYLPEHTLESFDRAIEMGADFIELDLVVTKDGVLVVRHENEISGTTDVTEKFPDRKTTKVIDGRTITGWFSEDFTLAEIESLRAKERLSTRSQDANGKFQVPTFEEVILLAVKKGAERKRVVGLYPEVKHSTYFRSIGLPLEIRLVHMLEKYGLNRPDAPVFVQSFEVRALKELRPLLRVPLIQLLGDFRESPYDFVANGDDRTFGDLAKDDGLREVATYAAGIGPPKQVLLSPFFGARDLIRRAHQHGLKVHPFTFRSDKGTLPDTYKGIPQDEYILFFRLGVDGVFSDFPDHALDARKQWFESQR